MSAHSKSPESNEPSGEAVLAEILASAPHCWFPSEFIGDRDAVQKPLWELCRAGEVEVAEWERGRGQGFRITELGRTRLVQLLPKPTPSEKPGDAVRAALTKPPPSVIAPIFIVLNLIWFAYGAVIATQTHAASDYLRGTDHPVIASILVRIGALSAGEFLKGAYWRLATCGFVHVGVFHLLGNLVILALLGSRAEAVWGRWRFLSIYLLSGLAGAGAALAFEPLYEDGRSLVLGSASASLWGVALATIVWYMRNLRYVSRALAVECVQQVAIVGIMNLVVSFAQGINWHAWLGGAIGGVIAAVALARIRGNRRESAIAIAGLILAIAAFVALFHFASWNTEDWKKLRTPRAAPQPDRRDAGKVGT